MLADPKYWVLAIDEIKYLKPTAWLGCNSMDHYLLQQWVKVKDSSAVWHLGILDLLECIKTEPPPPDVCLSIRRRLLMPEEGDTPMRPVAAIYYDHETKHYFTVLLNYERLHVTTFGRRDSIEKKCRFDLQPQSWNGQNIWRNVCIIFGWPLPDTRPTWWAWEWKWVNTHSE